jgi:predicted thioesterase
VGYRVELRHLAPTPVGKQVTAKVTLREVNGRRYLFDAECWNQDGVKIGEGVHERALIDISRFAGQQRA